MDGTDRPGPKLLPDSDLSASGVGGGITARLSDKFLAASDASPPSASSSSNEKAIFLILCSLEYITLDTGARSSEFMVWEESCPEWYLTLDREPATEYPRGSGEERCLGIVLSVGFLLAVCMFVAVVGRR